MGLFGSSPKKKLEKARLMFDAGEHYDALVLYEDLARQSGKLSTGELSEARDRAMVCRRKMIALRLEEAERLHQEGNLAGASDRCQTALELAGEEIEVPEVHEMLRRISAPRRPVASPPHPAEVPTKDLYPPPDLTAAQPPEEAEAQEAVAERTDEEILGEDPDALFEVYLHGLDPERAAFFRGLGVEFRNAYLALAQGAPGRAVAFFEEMFARHGDPAAGGAAADFRVQLEWGHALLLAGRASDALAVLDEARPGAAVSEADEQRRQYLRVEALRVLHRYDEAVAGAAALADSADEPVASLDSLLTWTLLDAGQAEEARNRLAPWVAAGATSEEILLPAAQAAAALGLGEEEMTILDGLISHRIQQSIIHGSEVEYPIQAGRRLLARYYEFKRDPDEIRAVLLHLLDHDQERAEEYRTMLLELGQR